MHFFKFYRVALLLFTELSLIFNSTIVASQRDQHHASLQESCANFAIGGISGAVAMVVYAPWGYFQNRRVQRLPIAWKYPWWWFRGAPGLAVGKAPVIGVQSASYEMLTSVLPHPQGELSPAYTTIAATLAGGASGPVGNISQLIALHQQTNGSGIMSTIRQFPEGYRSLSRGMVPASLREMIFTNAYMNLLPHMRIAIGPLCNDPAVTFAISAPLSGATVALLTQPLHVIVTKLHADITKQTYRGMIDAIRQTHAKEGWLGFYRGSAFRSMGVIVALPVLSKVQELLQTAYSRH